MIGRGVRGKGGSAMTYPKPEVGQIWESCDRRDVGRPPVTVLAVDETYAVVTSGCRQSRIRVNRMRPGSTGYRLVKLADGSRYELAKEASDD